MNFDFLIVGAGVAGLRAAIELAAAGSVLVVAKDELTESASEYAQGGIAAALSDDDEVSLHEHDTLVAGDGLCNPSAVRALVAEGPHAIEELINWGAEFDREGTRLLFAREGAHSRSRVLHARGDSTGSEIARTLYHRAVATPGVEFRSFAAVTDLMLDAHGEVCGACVYDAALGETVTISARAVLLATGGLGRVFRDTTNPAVATGDGVAMAYRAGAAISDLEFVQFHPTALHKQGAPRFLLSEALRGEGAYLRNEAGERFTNELAPRDVVSRAIVAEIKRTGAEHVYLDLKHKPAGFAARRFPRIYETCLAFGIDLAKQPAPVHPAAHYAMGGVRTDIDGRTNIQRLFAAGEVACTGVHGANRLASNSLLEGVVFGARAGKTMRDIVPSTAKPAAMAQQHFPTLDEATVRTLAWEACGIERNAGQLSAAIDSLTSSGTRTLDRPQRADFEVRSIASVLDLMLRCALARQESRGGHFRGDYPEKAEAFRKHSVISRGAQPTFDEAGLEI